MNELHTTAFVVAVPAGWMLALAVERGGFVHWVAAVWLTIFVVVEWCAAWEVS